MLHFGSLATVRYWKDSQVETLGADGYLCWAFAFSCIQCWIDLIPCTGQVSPQFCVVYADDLTTVPYLRTATVPPHWDELVCASSTIALYTESKVGTWQSLYKLNVNPGDIASDTVNVDTASSTTSTQFCEGDYGHSEGATDMVSHNENAVTKQVTFSNQGQDNEIQSNSPNFSITQPDEWQMPDNIDLEASGLQRSTQSTVLGW
jgi:hypothetical protein